MRHTRKKRLQLTRATSAFRQSPSSSNGGGSGSGHTMDSVLGGVGGDHLHALEPSLLQRVRVKYRTMRFSTDGAEKQNESESEALISGDDDDLIIGAKGGGGAGGGGGSLVSGVLQRTTLGPSIQMA